LSDLKEEAAHLQKFVKLFEKNPEAGLLKPTAKASTKDGLVILKSGNTTWEEDLPACLGGKGVTIGPTQHILGSLAGCAAGLIKYTLAPLTGTSIDSVDVDAQCEFDAKGCLGMKGATAEMRNVVLNITVYSNESRDKIEKLLEIWKQRAPIFLCFEQPVPVAINLVNKKPEDKITS
jgi:uncharacterized OsmC-like protein